MGIHLFDKVENIVGKVKLLVISNFSFSYNVFKSCLLLMCQYEYLWSKGLTAYANFVRTEPCKSLLFETEINDYVMAFFV